MAFSGVVTASGSSGDTSNVTSGSLDSTGAKLGIIIVGWYAGGTLSGVSDSKGNSWTLIDTVAGGVGGLETCSIYYSVLTSVGAGHTFTASGVGGFPSIAALTAIGGHTTPLDQKNKAANSATSGSITPGFANEIVIAGCVGNSTSAMGTLDGGFTTPVHITGVGGVSEGVGLGYLIQTIAAAANPAWSGGAVAGAQIASFKPLVVSNTGSLFLVF